MSVSTSPLLFERPGPHRSRGSALLELLVAAVILAIGIACAVPRYNNYVRQLHRASTKSALLEMARLEEQYLNVHGAYSSSPTDLGYSATKIPFVISGGYYAITELRTPAANATRSIESPPVSYSITATAVDAGANDPACVTFTITSAGVQSSTGSPNGTDCWH